MLKSPFGSISLNIISYHIFDCFANYYNHKLRRFFSRYWDPNTSLLHPSILRPLLESSLNHIQFYIHSFSVILKFVHEICQCFTTLNTVYKIEKIVPYKLNADNVMHFIMQKKFACIIWTKYLELTLGPKKIYFLYNQESDVSFTLCSIFTFIAFFTR